MTKRALMALAVLGAVALTGCSLGRQVTTRRFEFTQNMIPTRNHGSTYSTYTSTGGPIGPLPFDIVITGDVRNKYDRYHGGVDYCYLTYTAVNNASAPVRVRLWANLADNLNDCPQIENGAVPTKAALILDVTIPAKGTLKLDKDQGTNIDPLRKIVEALLQEPENAAACVYVQSDCDDPTGIVTIQELDVEGEAHGSLF